MKRSGAVSAQALALGGGTPDGELQPPTLLVPDSVTAPRDVVRARPSKVSPVPIVTAAWATTLPAKLVPFSVAALVTCQNTLHALAPANSETVEVVFATSVLAIWKI